jgi:hypothetical protein
MKGDKVVAICDRNCNVIAPMIFAPANKNESPLIREAIGPLKQMAKAGLSLNKCGLVKVCV